MGKFKDIVQFEKKNMPPYQWNFLYRRCLPSLFFIIGGAIVAAIFATVGSALEIDLLAFIPVGLYAATTLVLIILLAVYGKKVSKRLLIDKTYELEQLYALSDLETATQNLEKDNVIINDEIVVYPEGFENDQPFDELELLPQRIKLQDCDVFFYCKTWSGAFYFRLYVLTKDDHTLIRYVDIDKNVFCYFAHNANLIANRQLFQLFVDDKESFLKLLYKYNDNKKMENHLEKFN